MTQGQIGWLTLFILGLLLIIIGFQGNLGVTFAIIFCPKYVTEETTTPSPTF